MHPKKVRINFREEEMVEIREAISLPIRFLGVFPKTPKIPKTGETLKQWYLFPIASKDAASLEELIKHISNVALENSPCSQRHRITKVPSPASYPNSETSK